MEPIRPARTTDITFLSALKRLTTYVADAALNVNETEVFATIPLYRGTTKVGDIRGRLAKNANNELGYLLTYDPEAHSLTGNITISARLDLSFTPTDAQDPVDSHFFKVADMPMPATQIAGNVRNVSPLNWSLTGNVSGYAFTTSSGGGLAPNGRLNEPGGLALGVLGYKAALERGGVLLVHGFAPVGPSPSSGTTETVTLKDPGSSGIPWVSVAFQRLTGGGAYTRIFVGAIDTKSSGFAAGTTLVVYQVRF